MTYEPAKGWTAKRSGFQPGRRGPSPARLPSLIAGIVDVTSWLTLGGLFAAHFTGNLVITAADLFAIALFHMTGLNLQMSFGYAATLRFFQSIGLPFLFVPINTLAYTGTPRDKNNDVSGLTSRGSFAAIGHRLILRGIGRASFRQTSASI